jgi:hypothetical protein
VEVQQVVHPLFMPMVVRCRLWRHILLVPSKHRRFAPRRRTKPHLPSVAAPALHAYGQTRSATAGLSRRRSRVRVPSLPSLVPPAKAGNHIGHRFGPGSERAPDMPQTSSASAPNRRSRGSSKWLPLVPQSSRTLPRQQRQRERVPEAAAPGGPWQSHASSAGVLRRPSSASAVAAASSRPLMCSLNVASLVTSRASVRRESMESAWRGSPSGFAKPCVPGPA